MQKKKFFKTISVIIKIIAIIIVTALCSFYLHSLSVNVANEFALYQMTDNPDSSTLIYTYSVLMNYLWVVPTVFSILLFIPEIIYIIKYFINKYRKETTNNEEHN